MNWRTELRPTELTDPATGEPLYVRAKIRPRWYWLLRRLSLFTKIVWREWEPGYRLSWSTAWEVSRVAEGPTR